MEKKNGWLLPLVQNQIVAYMVLLLVGLLISLMTWIFFMKINGANWGNTMYWLVSLLIWLGPQIGLLSTWRVRINPQYRAQIIIRSERQDLWLTEGEYVIPFENWLFSLNLSEIQKTSKTGETRAFEIISQDKNGEIVILSIDAERKISNPTVYAEFDAEEMVTDENEILKNAAIRAAYKLDFYADVINATEDFSIEDKIFKSKCKKFGIHFENINFMIKLADSSSDSILAKRKRLVKDLIADFKKETGQTKLTSAEMIKINDQVELILKLNVNKNIYEGINGSKTIIPVK